MVLHKLTNCYEHFCVRNQSTGAQDACIARNTRAIHGKWIIFTKLKDLLLLESRKSELSGLFIRGVVKTANADEAIGHRLYSGSWLDNFKKDGTVKSPMFICATDHLDSYIQPYYSEILHSFRICKRIMQTWFQSILPRCYTDILTKRNQAQTTGISWTTAWTSSW